MAERTPEEAIAEAMYHMWRADYRRSRNWPEAHERQIRHWTGRAKELIGELNALGWQVTMMDDGR